LLPTALDASSRLAEGRTKECAMATVPELVRFPDHVPPQLRWDHSLREFAMEGGDPFLAVSRLFDGPDVFYARDATQGQPAWVITRHEHQREAFTDYQHFTSENGSSIDMLVGEPFRLAPIDYDPPEQTAFRRVINPFFTPGAVKAMVGPIRDTCDMLIARFEDRGGCEFTSEFAAPFPSYIFLSIVGMPIEEAPKFLVWENEMMRSHSLEQGAAAARAVLAYLRQFLAEQRVKPSTDFLRTLIDCELDGRAITDDEILGVLFTFYLGGLDTVYSTLGWIFRHLARDQDLQSRLRADPALIPHAVDEFARAYSVVSTSRRVASDFTFHGVEMHKGDKVVMPLFLAGRDPRAWDRPHDIDLARRPSALTFASGPHLCAGRNLARREMCLAIESFLSRFDNIHIRPGESYSYHTSPVYGVDRLPLEWTRRK
jgi:cytochrome P450